MKNKKHIDSFNTDEVFSVDKKTSLPIFSSVLDLSILIVIAILLFIWLIFIAKIFIIVFLCVYIWTWIYNKFIKK